MNLLYMRHIVIYLLFQFFVWGEICADPTEFRFNKVDVSNGLSSNEILSVFQDQQGFMWFGTTHGLNRYDGKSVKSFTYSDEDTTSLPDNHIYHIRQDQQGFIWILTQRGMSVYDPDHEVFTSASSHLEERKLPPLSVKLAFSDDHNGFYLVTHSNLIYQYDAQKNTLVKFDPGFWDFSFLKNRYVSYLENDSKGNIWIVFADGMLILADIQQQTMVDSVTVLPANLRNNNYDLRLNVDARDNLWIYKNNDARGLFFYNTQTRHVKHFTMGNDQIDLQSNRIGDVMTDHKNRIWIVTDHGGIVVMDKDYQNYTQIMADADEKFSLSQNSANVCYQDRDNTIWIGTTKYGVNYYNEKAIAFDLLDFSSGKKQNVLFNDVLCMHEDDKDNIWLGTNGAGLLKYDYQHSTFQVFEHDPDDPSSIGSDVIVDLFIDSRNRLWAGTYFGGLNLYLGNGTFQRFTYDPENPDYLLDDRAWSIAEDNNNHELLIGTLTKGMYVYSFSDKHFYKWEDLNRPQVFSDYVSCLLIDSQENLWIGSSDGITVYDKNNHRSNHYYHVRNDRNSLSNNLIMDFHEDQKGRIWIATNDGLNLFRRGSDDFVRFNMTDGLPDNIIRAVTEDENGFIWISTNNGLSRVELVERYYEDERVWEINCNNFNEDDGLQASVYNPKSKLKTTDGKILFGGARGVNIFDPQKVITTPRKPRVVFTNLQIGSEDISPGKKYRGRQILTRSITKQSSVRLKESEKYFSIGFSALNYYNASKIKYAYKLEGFHDNWVHLLEDEPQRVTFTNLNPGKFVLRVKAGGQDGFWEQGVEELNIRILPPFWKSPLAYVFYFFFIAFLLWLFRFMNVQKQKAKFLIRQEKAEAQKLHELDEMKINLFTKMSDEFRTPLSLIISPLESVRKQTDQPEVINKIELAMRNARRMMSMINQLLDFRKMDTKETEINLETADIIKFSKEITASFSDISERKNIQLSFSSWLDECFIAFDPDKIEKVLFNILSNAVKFTPDKGSITIEIKLSDNIQMEENSLEKSNTFGRYLSIEVKDTGKGISDEEKAKIFDRYHKENPEDHPGISLMDKGIGLSLSHEFIEMHKGKIEVISNLGEGSTFIIRLPLFQNNTLPEWQLNEKPDKQDFLMLEPEKWDQIDKDDDHKPLVLVAEENQDLKFMIRDYLQKSFRIIETSNAREALIAMSNQLPDLVLSDILLPGNINGFDLCAKVKNNPSYDHIPVILTCSRHTKEFRINSYEAGADAFITKPYNLDVLSSRISNLLKQHHQNSKNNIYGFHGLDEGTAKNHQKRNYPASDKKFMDKIMKIIFNNLSDPDFGVEMLSNQMNISRVHLYKKMRTLAEKSPSDMIRTMRIQKAAELLQKNEMTISEVCYQVGYNNPKYFSNHFKAEFKATPSDFKKHFSKKMI